MRENTPYGPPKTEGEQRINVLAYTRTERTLQDWLCCKLASILKEYCIQLSLRPTKFIQKENEADM